MAKKTISLGLWSDELRAALHSVFGDFTIFPLGAVPKRDSHGEVRLISDHTRSGLNAVTDRTSFRHSLTAFQDVARFLERGYSFAVADVSSAFANLPLHPSLWPHFKFRFFAAPSDDVETLFMHVHGDYGHAALPGTWYLFLTQVVVQMAKAVGVLTVPVAVFVDDLAIVAPTASQADAEMAAFQRWASALCGLSFKKSKSRAAATCNRYLGLFWDSLTLTLTLEETRLAEYVDMLEEFARASSLTLHQRQRIAGRMHRAVLTLPSRASCLLASVFSLMAGLMLPWARKRTTKAERTDYSLLASLLRLNLGRGFYRTDAFERGRALALSDASKSSDYCGGGYVNVASAILSTTSSMRAAPNATRLCVSRAMLRSSAAKTCVTYGGGSWLISVLTTPRFVDQCLKGTRDPRSSLSFVDDGSFYKPSTTA